MIESHGQFLESVCSIVQKYLDTRSSSTEYVHNLTFTHCTIKDHDDPELNYLILESFYLT